MSKEMLSYSQAQQVLEQLRQRQEPLYMPQDVSLGEAYQHYLARAVYAREDRPHGHISAMDGYGVRECDLPRLYKEGLPLDGRICRAGDYSSDHHEGTACQILTGARLPQDIDRVIALEQIDVIDGKIFLKEGDTLKRRNVRLQGEEFTKGAILIEAGQLVTWAETALIASQGVSYVPIARPPRIAILSNGWEFSQQARDRSYDINGPMLARYFEHLALPVTHYIARSDQPHLLRELLASLVERADILVTTGGVSVGRTDNVYPILDALGFKTVFRRLAIKPGKPVTVMEHAHKIAFALPGNPGAAAICARMFVLPYILGLQGVNAASTGAYKTQARTLFPIEDNVSRTRLLLVKIVQKDGVNYISHVDTKGASDITSLGRCDGIICVNARTQYPVGSCFDVHLFTPYHA